MVLASASVAGSSAAPAHQTVAVSTEQDIVVARDAGRRVCQVLGFGKTDQIKVATAISELARNIVLYAGQGAIEISCVPGPRPAVEILASDHGPGIDDLEAVLAGMHRSSRGLGLGLAGTRRLMDQFAIVSKRGQGTQVTIRKYLR